MRLIGSVLQRQIGPSRPTLPTAQGFDRSYGFAYSNDLRTVDTPGLAGCWAYATVIRDQLPGASAA